MESNVKITFLGGVGEIGKNMTAIEFENDIIVVDAGLTFPGDELPGIDLVVPDITYLIENKDKVRAIFLTHGHEDHIGGLPYVLSDLEVPVYGSRMTLALVENKLKEHQKIKAKLISVKPKNLVKVGCFSVEFIKVSHSISGALALAITTPRGVIVHSGDFKIDFQPIDGVMTDLTRFGELGKRGINLLLCESTNVCRKGYSMSESNVGKTLNELFDKHKNTRIIVATFASNIHRMQQVLNLAEKYKRKVAFSGRSMINVAETAMKIGEITFNAKNIVDIERIDKVPDNELIILSTGSQGEPMSALNRMASGEFKKVKLGPNDTVIISASPIPGNEKSVYNVINSIFKLGANVIYDELAEVHTSGHACQEELKIMHALTNPKFFIPVHGEYRHLKMHAELAVSMGMQERNILIAELGTQIEMGNDFIRNIGYVKAGQRLVDGLGLGDMNSTVLRDRLQLAEEGFCVVVLNLSTLSGELNNDPFIITRGLVYNDEAEMLIRECKDTIMTYIKNEDIRGQDLNLVKSNVRKELANFLFKKTKRRPLILTIIMQN
ncbi:MAG: ribonuclease J [Clostridia bacterium]